MNDDWHKNVYRKERKYKMKNKDEWIRIRTQCFKRDKYTCQRCDKINGQGRGLSAHHIIPRSEGGEDNIENLITLCNPCHDFVEINELRTRPAIIGSYEDGHIEMPKEKTAELTDEGYHFVRPEWHKYVYGGEKKTQ